MRRFWRHLLSQPSYSSRVSLLCYPVLLKQIQLLNQITWFTRCFCRIMQIWIFDLQTGHIGLPLHLHVPTFRRITGLHSRMAPGCQQIRSGGFDCSGTRFSAGPHSGRWSCAPSAHRRLSGSWRHVRHWSTNYCNTFHLERTSGA